MKFEEVIRTQSKNYEAQPNCHHALIPKIAVWFIDESNKKSDQKSFKRTSFW